MADDIYNAPQSELESQPTNMNYHLATTGQRFINTIIDSVGSMIFMFLLIVIIGLIGSISVIDHINELVLSYFLMFLYYFVQEALWGRTLGKLITRTKVLTYEGDKPSFIQIVGRTLVRFVPFEAFSFLGGNGLPRGWHDSWSGTKVISLKDPIE